MGGCEEPRYQLGSESNHIFDQMHGGDAMAVDKLAEGVESFAADLVKLEKLIGEKIGA